MIYGQPWDYLASLMKDQSAIARMLTLQSKGYQPKMASLVRWVEQESIHGEPVGTIRCTSHLYLPGFIEASLPDNHSHPVYRTFEDDLEDAMMSLNYRPSALLWVSYYHDELDDVVAEVYPQSRESKVRFLGLDQIYGE